MIILVIGGLLLGATLGRFFKVLVLVPACAFVLAAVLVRSANGEHGLLRPLLEFVVLITSLQIGYVFGLALFHSHSRRRMPRRAGELLKAMERRRLGGRLIIGCRIRLICRNQKPSRSLASRSSNHRTGRGSRRLPNGNSKRRLCETRRLPCGFTLACLQARRGRQGNAIDTRGWAKRAPDDLPRLLLNL